MRLIAVIIAYFGAFFLSWWASKGPWEISAGDSEHAEIFRLREDTYGIRSLLMMANALLAAILAALVFSD
jgi:hypothetical protein